MKVLTVTLYGHSYGANLQAYALQNILISLGYENKIIDYRERKYSIFTKINIKVNKGSIATILSNMMMLLRYHEHKTRFNKFESFINDDLILTRSYDSYEELKSNPPVADVYLVGSDQVWRMTNEFRESFFLRFGKSDIKRISYAASMGTYDLNTDEKLMFGKLLGNLDKISVREKDASDFIKDNYNIESEVHIDPVFLLDKDKWNEIAIDYNIDRKYILCYPLLFSPLLNESLKKLKQMTGYDVIVITPHSMEKVHGDIYIRNAGPKEFLGLIKNAQIVLTTSFHGTAFSIIFEKRFYSFPVYNTSRIANILNLLELNDRQVSAIEDISLDGLNYEKINIALNKEVNKSIDYLQRALEK